MQMLRRVLARLKGDDQIRLSIVLHHVARGDLKIEFEVLSKGFDQMHEFARKDFEESFAA